MNSSDLYNGGWVAQVRFERKLIHHWVTKAGYCILHTRMSCENIWIFAFLHFKNSFQPDSLRWTIYEVTQHTKFKKTRWLEPQNYK